MEYINVVNTTKEKIITLAFVLMLITLLGIFFTHIKNSSEFNITEEHLIIDKLLSSDLKKQILILKNDNKITKLNVNLEDYYTYNIGDKIILIKNGFNEIEIKKE